MLNFPVQITVCFLPPGRILTDTGLISLRMIHVVQSRLTFSALLYVAKCIDIYNVYILPSFITVQSFPRSLERGV